MTTRLSISVLLLLSLSFPFLGSTTYAVTSDEVEILTQQVHDLHAQYRNASPGKQPQILAELGKVVAARKDLLVELIQQNPKEALRIAMPIYLRDGLPAAVQRDVEQDVTADGTLEILHEDRDVGSRYLHFLWTAQDSRYSLHFADSPVTLKTGDRVRVKGLRIKRVFALSSGSTNVTTLATALPNTLGSQNTLMILVNFQDNPTQPYSVSTAMGVLDTTSNFDMENSYQQTWLTANVVGWYTIPLSSSVCDYATLANYAQSAASSAGINLSAYKRFVYAFPQNACGWWGLGTVGGTPSQAWINGSLQLRVLGHEMGHNLGLWHSHALQCSGVTIGTSCSNIEYGDTFDIMGATSAHYNAFQKQRLGWLNAGVSPPITTVQSSGTYTLDPYEVTGTNSKALKILKDATSKTWYYVEFRQPAGFDSFISGYSNVLNGVVIHTGSDSSGDSSYLLDMTPATSSWSDPALDVGLTFSDPASGVTISTQSVSGSSAVVNVSVGSTPCVPAAPTVSLAPSQSQTVTAGTSVSYTVSITNNDTVACSGSTYSVQMIEPTGWNGSLGSSSLSIGPGASVSTMLTVASDSAAPNGSYPVGATAAKTSNTTLASTGSATYNIGTAPPPPPCHMRGKSGKCK
jgi:hypothetical protein